MSKSPHWAVRYGVAVLSVAVTLAVLFLPDIGRGAASLPFLAVIVSAWVGGLRLGLFATALSTAAAVVLMRAKGMDFPTHRFVTLALFAGGGVLISFLVEALRAARDRAEANQRWLTAVLTGIGDGVIATDARGRVTFTNPVTQTLTGWGPEEARGRPLRDVFRIISEETREPVEDPVSKVIRKGTVVGLANHTLLISRDGTERPIDDSAAPIRDDAGRVAGVVLVYRDVTDRKLLEGAQRTTEERFRMTADSAPVLIWLAGTDNKRTWFNKPWLDFVGRTLEQELGDGWTRGVHPDDFTRWLSTYSAAIEARRPFKAEYRMRRADGVYRWVLDHGVPLRGEGGELTGYIGSCVDITDRIAAEEELKEADRRKDEFLAMLAHELRNPLSAISNAVQLAKKNGWRVGQDWTQDVLERQVRHLARLIDDLLDVSRVSRGKIQLRTKVIDLAPVVRAAAESVMPLVEDRKHRLEVTLPDEPLAVEGDPTRLEQIVVNLLTNAAKYTESGGRIAVSAGRDGDSVVVDVRDDGVGIPPDQLPRMFELFAQGDRSLARSEGGLGIGLTLVRSLAEMHGGSVTARSDGPGRGSEFTVRLPAAASLPEGPEAPPPAGPERAGACRVLVVDDNVDTVRGMSRLLKLLGHDVRTAYDGPSAIEAARTHRPESVVLDIGLPGMDGFQVARRLREEGHLDAVIIAVSGYGQDEDRRRSRDAGIDHHLVKPVDHDVLISLLTTPSTKPIDVG